MSIVPTPSQKGLFRLIIMLASLFLVSCSHAPVMNNSGATGSQEKSVNAQKGRAVEPQPGDVRVDDGVEFIYGKNVKYHDTPYDPLYVWVRRDLYSPMGLDSLGSRSTASTRELSKLQERLAKLEQQLGIASAPPTAHPSQPIKDEAGRTWTSYWKNDRGVESFYDEGTLLHPSGGSIQVWRKRVFPPGMAQKEIVTLDEIDCREARYRTRELQVTYWDGATQTSDRVTPWANVFTNSPEEYLINQHCK